MENILKQTKDKICKNMIVRSPSRDNITKKLEYSISSEDLDAFLNFLGTEILKDSSPFEDNNGLLRIYVNDIYTCLRDSGFIDRYLLLHFDHKDNKNNKRGIIDLHGEVLFSFSEIYEQLLSTFTSNQEKLVFLEMFKKRILGIQFLTEFINEKNSKEDNLRYADFKAILNDLLVTTNLNLDIFDDNRTPIYSSKIPYTPPEEIMKNTNTYNNINRKKAKKF